MERNRQYLKYFDKAKTQYSSFRFFFFKEKLLYKKLFKLNNFSFISFFKVMSMTFRKTFLFSNTSYYIYHKLSALESSFIKHIRVNKAIRRLN